MFRTLSLIYLLLVPLFLMPCVPSVHPALLPVGSTGYTFTLGSGRRSHYVVDAFANTTVAYTTSSNVSVSTAFMTSSEFKDLRAGNGSVADSITDENGTETQETVHVTAGPYYIVFLAYAGGANVTFSYTMYPNNPLSGGPLTSPEPSGIASYGLSNQSGMDYPYTVNSSDIIGFASISSLKAYNSTARSVGANPSGATLQLNSVLVVNAAGGVSQVYWCQNTPDFVTATSQLTMADNIWNFSANGFLSNETITSQGGEGTVSTYQQNGTQYFYSYEGSNSTYSLPLGLVLLMNTTVEQGTGVLVQFGARSTGGGADGKFNGWFDNITIHDSAVQSAYFFTSGNATTPGGLFYDTELVWAGESNGEATNFPRMDSSLGLYYGNGNETTLKPFPSYFSFGYDTDESDDDLMVRYAGNGVAQVTTGRPNYDYLGAASGLFSGLSVEVAMSFPDIPGAVTTSTSAAFSTSVEVTSSSSSPSTTTVTGQTVSSSASVASASSSSPNGSTSSSTNEASSAGIPEFPYQLGVATAVIVLVAASYLIARRRTAAPSATRSGTCSVTTYRPETHH